MQEHADGLAASQHVRYELAGQRLGAAKGHEDTRRFSWLRIGRNAHRTAFAHFLDDAENAFLGRCCHPVAQLHALFAQQVIHRFQLGRTVKDDRLALAAIEVIEHFPVAQVTGNPDYALARRQRFLEHLKPFDFTH